MKAGDRLRQKVVACPRCDAAHEATRSDACCTACLKAKQADKMVKWRARNAEKRAAYIAEWRSINSAHVREYSSRRKATHRALYAAVQTARHARQLNATPEWSDGDAIAGMYELCAVFRRIGLKLHVDHIYPLQGKTVCGLHVQNNLQLLHEKVNMQKKNRMPTEAMTHA